MEYFEGPASPRTAHVVDRYFYLTSHASDVDKRAELVVPDNTPGLMIVLDQHLIRRAGGTGNASKLKGAYLFGQKTAPVHYSFPTGGMRCIGLKLKPAGLAKLTSIPAHELTDSFLEAEACSILNTGGLRQTLSTLDDMQPMIRLLDMFISDSIAEEENSELTWTTAVAGALARRAGNIRIRDIANTFHSYPKMLERRFLRYIGTTPKAFCRILRFNTSVRLRQIHSSSNFSDIAQRAGYFDQMHYIREFKAFTGLTPTAFFNQTGGTLSETLKSTLGRQA